VKATKCEWCGEPIGPNDDRVKMPYHDRPGSMTYDPDCYVRVFDKRALRALVADDYPHGESVGKALRVLLAALDPEGDDDE
jgi:hypothetical protein